jgi:hypothetical protein
MAQDDPIGRGRGWPALGEAKASCEWAFAAQLSPHGLKRLADQEINRLGVIPAAQGGVSAPGTNPAALDLNFINAPSRLPSLENEVCRLVAAITLAGPKPLPRLKE